MPSAPRHISRLIGGPIPTHQVIDPPFITREVWEKYAVATRMLLKEGGKILASTIQENKDMMAELLGLTPQRFLPSIPHLARHPLCTKATLLQPSRAQAFCSAHPAVRAQVYQYCMYTNYESQLLSQCNPEIPPDD